MKYNFIIKKIDPSLFNVEKNALGWIIYSFESIIEYFKKVNENDKYCTKVSEVKVAIDAYDKLKKGYIYSRDFYRENLSGLSEGKLEYEKANIEIGKSDLELAEKFRSFINKYINAIQKLFEDHNEKREPLIVISFDDIDIKPQYGPDILETIINYLSHPNIVVLLSGDYYTFKETLFIDMWNKSKIPQQFSGNETIFNENLKLKISDRVEDILAKVMPPKYKYNLKDFSIDDRFKFTPYGTNCDNIAILLSNVVTGTDNLLFKYFIETIINVDSLVNETKDKVKGLEESKEDNKDRNYQGVYNEWENLKKYNSISKEIINLIKAQKDEDSNTKLVDKIINTNLWSSFAYALPSTPRGLINFYYILSELISNKEYKLQPYSKSIAYADERSRNINNFNFIKKLYDVFINCNLQLKYNGKYGDINNVIKFDSERTKVIFDFENITITNGKDFKHKIFNTSKTLIMKYKNESMSEEEILCETEVALIQLFYDLVHDYMNDDYIEVSNDKDLSKTLVYRRSEDNAMVYAQDLATFTDYHIMQSLYEMSLPLIAKDLKVHRNIRDRLRANMANIINYITKTKDKSYKKYILEVRSIKDVKKEDYKEKLYNNYEKYYGEYYAIESLDNEYKLLQFITDYKENGYFYDIVQKYIDNYPVIELYANLSDYIFNSQIRSSRIQIIRSILNDSENSDMVNKGDYILIDYLYSIIDKLDNIENASIIQSWNEIAVVLYKINCLLVVKYVKTIMFEDEEIEETLGTNKTVLMNSIREIIYKLKEQKEKLKKGQTTTIKNNYDTTYVELLNALFENGDVRRLISENDLVRIETYINKYEKVSTKEITKNDICKFLIENAPKRGKSITSDYIKNINSKYDEAKDLFNEDTDLKNFIELINSKQEEKAKSLLLEIINKLLESSTEDLSTIILEELEKRKKFFGELQNKKMIV